MTVHDITIITPTLNAAKHLPRALRSVSDEIEVTVEHLIVDGGSTDGTAALAATSSCARLISMPGAGIYEAVAGGLIEARGALTLWLNADDALARGGLAAARAFAARHVNVPILAFGWQVETEEGAIWRRVADHASIAPTLCSVLFDVPAFNAKVFRTEFLREWLKPEPELRLATDRLALARMIIAGAAIEACETLLYRYTAHADSLTLSGSEASRRRIFSEHVRMASLLLAAPASSEQRRYICEFAAVEAAKAFVLDMKQGLLPSRKLIGDVWRATGIGFPSRLAGGLKLRRRLQSRIALQRG